MISILRVMHCKNYIYTARKFTISVTSLHPYYLSECRVARLKNDSRNGCLWQRCNFHTTQKLCIPPILSLFLHRLVHIGAIIYGRSIRRWWARKSEKEKAEYKQWFKERKNVFLGAAGFLVFSMIAFYVSHIETHPITKRRRVMLFTKEQQATLNKYLSEMFMDMAHPVLPKSDPSYQKVARVLNKLRYANRDMKSINETQWKIYIVDLPIMNAFILPGGSIFIFKKILDTVDNDDQLGIILAHEMAHEALEHATEKLSELLMLDMFMVIPLIILWTIFPNIIGGLFHFLGSKVVDVAFNVPYSKMLENEADSIGLTLAQKACMDLREGVVYWGRMRILNELKMEEEPIPWFATHPSHSDREKKLNDEIHNMINIRNQFGCPRLSPVDPRERFYKQSYDDHVQYFKHKGII